jgi:multidrug efflux pump subunit AcrA (membrane-fusion protein)
MTPARNGGVPRSAVFGGLAIVVLIVAIGFATQYAKHFMHPALPASGEHDATAEQGHDDHAHDHAGHEETTSIELSSQALKNIGFEPFTVKLDTYEKTISLPAIVAERPGKSQLRVSAPLTGIVTAVHVIQGEAVEPDSPLFEIRLTHEELVSAQGEFLRLAEELDVVNREINRLESITEGLVAGRRILEQKYERQKLEGLLRANRQGLLLHGLSDEQVDEILKTRQLLQSLTIYAPGHEHCATECQWDHLFHIQTLDVQMGEQVTSGDTLCVLADHCELYIEGTAFEEDAQRLREALAAGTTVSADLLVSNRRELAINDLKILYISDQVDRVSRAFHFYLTLPNEVVLDRTEGVHRFLQWQFNPGQRMELLVPVERLEQRIVVPSDAVVSEGAEYYVYQQNGDHFDRVPVHVEHRDQKVAVIANDGSIFPGDVIAGHGAFQIHLAIKNQSGGGIDPHAGHQH